ncbi:DNA polymerase theta [Caenorhabditis elegans]|uniref:DNA polymerase theta n=1 Tax=Caenorhabditis elegans TaxID=6239 RepID=DPOLQ_CAEEL|nr:DNA polymerase theta [Caenorhabditis elegans]A0FLQ6.3 RecName: Full=DNA polymerase theta [Caenorhabditis elegans]CCD73325.2 DNA polymerase theta [Caenorhabditis elegans]
MDEASCRFPEWVSSKIIDYYAEQNIKALFDWQIDVLNEARQFEDQHLIFSAPTSAGKSIVAELLSWKVASTGRKVLFVLPYISVAREKLHQIQRCWRRDDISVCGFIGPQASNPNEWLGAVCTIEKAASLTNRALSEDWFEEIGMIVVDEMHMVFDSSRGAHIEHMLSKVLLWNQSALEKVRIIGMSATIPELYRIGKWLDGAKVFEARFRPIVLQNHIVIGSELRKSGDNKVLREFSEDPLILLTEESFRRNSQTLVMISSKLDAEKTALNIASRFHEINKTDSSLLEILKERANGLLFIKHGLERNGCKDRNVMSTLAWGVAYHHAGLTMEERECIELGFREKNIVILVATSTLASGVNLPAERVLIKAQPRGPSALTSLNYRQMVGRAGRTGHATRGETYLLIKKCDRDAVLKIIETPIDQGVLTRKRDAERTNLSRFILEGICTGLTTTRSQIHDLCKLLLFNSENLQLSDIAIEMLLRNSFISQDENDDQLSPTQLGRAAIASSLPPEASLAIFEDLNSASRAIALDTELHMLYLVTPINVSVWQECDWHHLFSIFSKLPSDHKRIAKLVGVSEKFILDQLQGRRNDKLLQIHIRFFSALALFDLISEMSIYEVSHKYRIPRGCLQTLQSQSATYAAMIVAFCLRLGWTYLKALLDGFATRLLFGVRSELSELVAIEGIDGQRARILHERGVTCLSHLSACDSSKLAHFLTLAVPYSSSNSNDGLGEWLFGEPRMRVDVAARTLKERARKVLIRRVQELGISVELPKFEENEENIQESCDSGLPDSCEGMEDELEEKENIVKMEEMTKSVTEMSLTDNTISFKSEDDLFKKEIKVEEDEVFIKKEIDEDEEEIVEETVIECLETSLLKLKASTDEVFLRRLSQTFSPIGRSRSILNNSLLEDSFDRPVPRSSIPILNFITPKRESPTPYFEDSFDRPIPGSLPISSSRRKSVLTNIANLDSSRRESINSNASDNNSFDVFVTPPTKSAKEEKRRIAVKHPRVGNIIYSPLTSSPVIKHPKLEINHFYLKDVCHDHNAWNLWTKSSTSTSSCSIRVSDDYTGIAIRTDAGNTFIPLLETFGGEPSPASKYFESFSKCIIPLNTRLEFLKTLAVTVEMYISSMEDAFLIFEKFGIKIFRLKVVRIAAYLNNVIDVEQEENSNFLPILMDRYSILDPEIRKTCSSSLHKAAVEVYSLKPIFEKMCCSGASLQLEMESCQTVLNIFYSGIVFDQALCNSFIYKIRKQIENLEENIWRLAYGKFNIHSSNEVANVLFYRLGLIYPETSGCKPKLRHLPTNKLILEQMNTQHPIVGKILEYRQIQHTLTQCLMPLAKFIGRIHCWFEMCTSTGRILTSVPNLQNVPKRISSDGMSARQLFIANSENLLIGADYKQLELRVLAHLSNDSNLVNLITSDRDLFEELSIQWNFPRDAVKQLCYGLIYGMGAKSLSELTRMSIEDAEKMLKAFFAMFPGVRSYINETKEKVCKEEPISTIIGRRTIIKASGIGEERARIERVAVNYTIQGSASEIFKTAIVDIESKIKEFGAQIVLTIHDEVLVECPEIHVAAASESIENCMQNALSHLLRVPMRVSMKTGRSWADLK